MSSMAQMLVVAPIAPSCHLLNGAKSVPSPDRLLRLCRSSSQSSQQSRKHRKA